MENTITPHPLRLINLTYHPDKPKSELETEVLESYFYMHDEVWRLKEKREHLETALSAIPNEITELHARLYPMEQELELYEVAFGIQDSKVIPDYLDSITLDTSAFREAAVRHNADLVELHTSIVKCISNHNAFIEEYDKFEEWFEEFIDNKFYKLFHDWENISVDTVSLDDDHQDFLSKLSPITKADESYFELAASSFDGYNILSKAASEIYKRTETIDQLL